VLGVPAAVLGASLCALALGVLTALVGLDGVPHVSDEIAYTLQSRLFAAGMRTGPPADNPSLLLYPFWQTAPRSFGVFPPGWPALLALGERLGVPWLVNPLLFAASPTLTWLLARELTPRGAILAPWLVALSPGMWLLAGSRMAQTSALVALLVAAVAVVTRRSALWVGAAVAYVVVARPFDAALLGLPLLGFALTRGLPHRPALVALPGLAVALLMADNHHITGDALRFPVNAWYDAWVADLPAAAGCNRLGFGADRGCYPTLGSPGHSPGKALQIAAASLQRMDRLLLGVPLGGLAALAGAWTLGARRSALLLAPLAAVAGGYALYWSPGMAYGARFWHPGTIGLILLAAAGLSRLPGRAGWAVLLIPAVSVAWIQPQLGDYWCVDGRLAAQVGRTEGVVFVQRRGTRAAAWPAVGVDAFECDPMLSAGDGMGLLDPTRTTGGLQFRHALPTAADTRAYLARRHPGAAALLWREDLETGEVGRLPLDQGQLAPLSGSGEEP